MSSRNLLKEKDNSSQLTKNMQSLNHPNAGFEQESGEPGKTPLAEEEKANDLLKGADLV